MNTDYSSRGVTIQQAMLMERKRNTTTLAKDICINWGGASVKTADWIQCKHRGIITIEMHRYLRSPRQAIDIRAEGGYVLLPSSKKVLILRTWADSNFEDKVQYEYSCAGEICISTATETELRGGESEIEKFTGNSGFWLEPCGNSRTYHSSFAGAEQPDFESLVFTVTLGELPADS